MQVPVKQDSWKRYQSVKGKLAQAAADPKNEGVFKVDGERVELSRSVRFELEGQSMVVKQGSNFDNDPKTRDQITLENQTPECVNTESYQHYSERRGWLFKHDQEMLQVDLRQQQGFNFSQSSATFEL